MFAPTSGKSWIRHCEVHDSCLLQSELSLSSIVALLNFSISFIRLVNCFCFASRLLRRFVLDLQSWYVVKQFLIATGKLLNPDPRRLSTGQLRSLGMAPFRAGDIIIGSV